MSTPEVNPTPEAEQSIETKAITKFHVKRDDAVLPPGYLPLKIEGQDDGTWVIWAMVTVAIPMSELAEQGIEVADDA